MPKVVITLPAYRAEATLAKTVADIPAGVADQLILVDDASADHTVERARELGIEVHVHEVNRGYGGNQKTCYTEALRAGADVVVLLHPDYQYDPKAVPLLIAPILAGDADMTFGSRFAGLGDPMGGGMPLYRYLGNRFTTTVENLLLGARFTDMHSGLARLHAQVPAVDAVPELLRRLHVRLAVPDRRGDLRPAGRRGPDPDALHEGVVVDLGVALVEVRDRERRLLVEAVRRARPPGAAVPGRR